MLETLKEISAVDGVAGAFVCDAQGTVRATDPPNLFEPQALAAAAQTVGRTMAAVADSLGQAPGELDLLYADSRLLVLPMEGGHLCLMCVPQINMALLKLRANLAIKTLQAQVAQAGQPQAFAALVPRLQEIVRELLGEKAAKPLEILAVADPTREGLTAACDEVGRFTRLFLNKAKADDVTQRLRAVLDASSTGS